MATNKKFPSAPFTVNVIIDDLNIRSEGSMKGKVSGQTGKGTFTIVEVKDGWGRLKSGAGWIYLENDTYCTINGTTESKDYSTIGKQLETCLNDIKCLASYKKLNELL